MSRTLRSPMVRGSTVLLGLGVLLWLLLRAPVSAPHHGLQAYAPFQILARHLQEPSGLARDPVTGDLFVAEADTGLILRIHFDDHGHAHLRTFAPGFKRPRGLAWDTQDGSLLVVDEKAGSLSRITQQGKVSVLRKDLEKPQGVAVGEDGTIYVTAEEGAGFKLRDAEEGVLLSFAPDGSKPQLLVKGLKRPEGLRVLPDGSVRFVADRLRSEPEREGGTVFEWTPGEGLEVLVRSGFKQPHDLTLDALDATYLTADRQRDGEDWRLERGVIGKAFSEEGVALFATGLKEARGLLFDAGGNLYVAEAEAGRILKFLAPRPPVLDPPPQEVTKEARLTLTGTTEPNAVLTVRGAKAPLPPQDDVSAQVALHTSHASSDDQRGRLTHRVTLTNTGDTPLAGPLAIVLTSLKPSEVTLANATGTTTEGDPYVEVALLGGFLRPGEHVQATLRFVGPHRHRVRFTHAIWALRPVAVSDATGHFSFPVTLTPNTENQLELFATAHYGLGLTSAPARFTATATALMSIAITPPAPTRTAGKTLQFQATGALTDGSTQDVTTGVTWTSSNESVATIGMSTGLALAKSEGSTIITAAHSPSGLTATATLTVTLLPPNPNTVAPPLDRGVATGLKPATEFLYTGPNPVQAEVAPGTIEPRRVAVLRGRVLSRDGTSLSGVTISILSHPEFGTTLSRTDGMFDLAVNGGSLLTVRYEKAGYPMAQRPVTPRWQDYALLPDVILTPLDTRVTTVDLTAPNPIQVARGNPVTDSDGTRQATLFFPQGTTATMQLSDGTSLPLTSLHVRATEYTVGPDGPTAMPAPLPPTSAYTYAIELSADEALNAGAKSVQFSRPVTYYVENFLNFPVGGIVPVGYYDRDRAAWVPSDNGVILKILSVTAGLADVDVTGSGTSAGPSALTSLGITDAERQQLAALYPPGQSLWRVPIPHFSPFDCNWGFYLPPDSTSPGQSAPRKQRDTNRPTASCGSIIQCQNQTLGEAVDIVGTPFRLHYQSDRAPGRKGANAMDIPLSGPTVPASLKRIELDIWVAGQEFKQTFAALPNQAYQFTWDGRDGYGRLPQGAQSALVRIGYVYDMVYSIPNAQGRAFAVPGIGPFGSNPARRETTLWQEQWVSLGAIRDGQPQALGLGGWFLNVHHLYDQGGQVLLLGSGERRAAADLGAQVLTTVAGSDWDPNNVFGGDGGPATSAKLGYPVDVAVDGQGSLFIADWSNQRIRRVRPDGTIITVAGTGNTQLLNDGAQATEADLFNPSGVAVDGQGNFFIADTDHHRIRKVGPDGIISTVAGGGAVGLTGDGGPATSAGLRSPSAVAVDGQGNLFIADSWNHRIRKVGPDGIITTVAGSGPTGFFQGAYGGDGGPATSARLNFPAGVAVDGQGNLFIADSLNHRIRKVRPDGIISTVAGSAPPGFSGDGDRAIFAKLYNPGGVALDAQGNLFIADTYNNRIRKVSPDGIITTVAGTDQYGFNGDGGLARNAQLDFPSGVAVDAQGNLSIADTANRRIRKLVPALPGFSNQEFSIPSDDGSDLYAFSSLGQHLRTVNALTGAIRYSFGYDSGGRLSSITDGDGNVTQIERDGVGNPTAIIAPFGQRTTLSVDANGYLASITDPASSRTQLTYAPDGLLATLTTPRGDSHRFTYDDLGRLTRDEDPAGGVTTLARSDAGTAYTATRTTALNRTSTYLVETLADGGTHQVDTAPDGTQTDTLFGSDASRTTTVPDGTVTTLLQVPDPRFGMQAPLPSTLTVTTPGGVTSTVTTTRSVTLSDLNNLLSLIDQTDTVTLNGRTGTSTYTAATKTFTDTSPAGRQVTSTLDPQGRVLTTQVTGLAPITFAYDSRGRLSTMTQGTGTSARTSTFAYNPQGFLASLMDPLSRTVNFAYDPAGRVTTQTLADGRAIQTSYDANGNVASITPPSRPAHAFTYTPVDLEATYTPPELGIGTVATTYTHNADRQLTQVTRPDSQSLTLGYDTGGRLATLTAPTGPTTFTYHPTTGQVTSIAAPGGVGLSYTHDGPLLLGTTWSGPVAGSVTRTYDTDFRVATESINGGNPVTFQYDSDSLLTQAGSLSLTRNTQNGLLTGTTVGSVSDTRTYSTFGELSTYQANYSGSTLINTQYARDALGRISQKTETIGGVTDTYTYGYDQAGRLTDVTKNGMITAHYEYDPNGNRLAVTRPGSGTVSGTYDAQDRLVSYGAVTYTYTANGDLQTATGGGETSTYAYDVFGNLIAATLPTGTQIEYIIDGQNRRIGKKVNGVLIQGFLYGDQLRPIAELDGTGSIVARFVYGTKVNVPDHMVKAGVTYRLLTDHLGGVRLVLDTASGAVAQRIDYDEFGQITQDTNPGFQPFGFAGGLHDLHTGLTRFGARDYDAFTGRWTTKDPTGFGGGDPNLFGYALNDAVNSSDSLGLRLEGVQVRSHETGSSSLTLVNPDNPREVYYFPLNEPAGWGDAMGSFGYGAALPPGEYLLEPRSGSSGRIIPKGYPVYTTPGQPPGTVIAPYGFRRYWIGPHYGWYSGGCPLIDPNLKSKNVREQLREVIQKHQASGGTRVRVVEY